MKELIFEWDEKKRLSNIEKHGLDFNDAKYVFKDENLKTYEIENLNEKSFLTIGYFKKELCIVILIHTNRKEKTRIISFRKANKREMRKYYGNS
jgi:uncharacterized DUF497 family protein